MNADGTGLRRLIVDLTLTSAPAWSADGNIIAFMVGDGNEDRLMRMDPDGRAVHEIAAPAGYRGKVAWYPKGIRHHHGRTAHR